MALAATCAVSLLAAAEGLALWWLGVVRLPNSAVSPPDLRSIRFAPSGASGAAVVLHSGDVRQSARFEAVRVQLRPSPQVVAFSTGSEVPTAIACSPTGGPTVVGCRDGTLLLYPDGRVREPVLLGQHGDGWVMSVEFSPDGRYAASVERDLRIWDLQRRRERLISACERQATCAAFSPDSRCLYTGGSDGRLCAWDVASGNLVSRIGDDGHRIYQLACSPSGGWIATVNDDLRLKLWRIGTDGPLWSRPASSFPVQPLAFSPQGKTLASTAWAHPGRWSIVLWDVSSGEQRARFELEDAAVIAMLFTAEDELCAFSADGAFRRWKTNPRRQIERIRLQEYL